MLDAPAPAEKPPERRRTGRGWRRGTEHLAGARAGSTSAKAAWLRELLAAGFEPSVVILTRTTRQHWRSVEESWIARYEGLTNRGAEAPEPQTDGDEEEEQD
jgi:hypothetical protein